MSDIKFIHKTERGSAPPILGIPVLIEPSPTIIDGLSGNSLKSHIQDQSCKIVQGSTTLALLANAQVGGWILLGNKLKITGPNSVMLNFISSAEAIIAETRLKDCLNGIFVI